MRKPLPLLALALLAACSRPAPQKPQARQAAPMAASPAAVTAGETGVGPINAQVPFEAPALEKLFPGAHVEPAVMTDGDRRYPILTVMGPNLDMIIEVDGGTDGKITAATVLGGNVPGPGGETLMKPWSELGFKPTDCAPGQARDLAALVCHRPGAPRLAYIVGIRSWSGPGTPSPEKLAADGFLREMRWTPPA